MNKNIALALIAFLLASCGSMNMQTAELGVDARPQIEFAQWDVPHTNLTMLLPDGWVTDYYQGTISIATDGSRFFYSPSEPFEGVLITMFLSEAPRVVGPSFDVMQIATDFIADQPNVVQDPLLVEQDGRQIITTVHVKEDTKGKVITYLTGYVIENQELTVFIAATPRDTELFFLPILQEMLYSIQVRSPL